MDNAERPAVSDDVVQSREQDVFVLAQAHNNRAHQRTNRKIEGAARFMSENVEGFSFALAFLSSRKIYNGDIEGDVLNELHGLAINGAENRAQSIVTSKDRLQRFL